MRAQQGHMWAMDKEEGEWCTTPQGLPMTANLCGIVCTHDLVPVIQQVVARTPPSVASGGVKHIGSPRRTISLSWEAFVQGMEQHASGSRPNSVKVRDFASMKEDLLMKCVRYGRAFMQTCADDGAHCTICSTTHKK